MKQQHVDRFKSKFHLLNSQESSEEIIWSCSDSSDYENSSYNDISIKPVKRKRKRVQSKKNISNNISNLDITFVDRNERNNEKDFEKSPDYSNVQSYSDLPNVGCKSPILTSSQRYFAPFKINKSPVLSNNCKENKQTSPVLLLRNSVQKFSPKVKKKLFDCNENVNIETKSREHRSPSPVLTCTQNVLKTTKTSKYQNENLNNSIIDRFKHKSDRKEKSHQEYIVKCKETQNKNQNYTNQSKKHEYSNLHEQSNEDILDDTSSIKSVALIEKVKSYFDSHFSSVTPSQQSISEFDSKSSPKSNNDIEIINSLPNINNSPTIKLENNSLDTLKTFDNVYDQKTKKVRYKKDGLAYRLNVLLKKQHAGTSLWYHERFLAANSNFVLPKEEFLAFRIEKVSFKYGCYLLNVLDVNNEVSLIFINNLYIRNDLLEEGAVFKLYKPYKMLEFDGYKLIVNVCKYEYVVIKK